MTIVCSRLTGWSEKLPMDGQTPEHFLEVLFTARDRAVVEADAARRTLWLTTVRDIETIFADNPPAIAAARDRLSCRTDPDGRRMHAYLCDLMASYDAADNAAREAIERARKG